MDEPNVYAALFKALDGKLVETAYKRGEIICRPTDSELYCYFIKSGLVKSYTTIHSGKQETRNIFGHDEIFPIPHISGQAIFNSYYEALNDCEIVRIRVEDFLKVLKANPEVTFAILNKVVGQFTVYISRVDNLSYRYARERLAYRLLYLATRFGETCDDDTMMLPFLTQQELGATINLTRESVSRELGRLERQNMIEYRENRIALLDPKRLRKQISANDDTLWFDMPKSK